MSVAPETGISVEELRLAARNHAMLLEALRWPITPVGLHYLLTHYDVPLVDPTSWRLELVGAVERPLSFTLDELRSAIEGNVDNDVQVSQDTTVLTLSTCISAYQDQRWLVSGTIVDVAAADGETQAAE